MMNHHMPPSKSKRSNHYPAIFIKGFLIVLLGEAVGLLLYFLSDGNPNNFLLWIYIGVLVVLAIQMGKQYGLKKTFIYASVLAFMGGCSGGGKLADYSAYINIPHEDNVDLSDLIANPGDYDEIDLFYLNDAFTRIDILGENEVPADTINANMPAETFYVCPLVRSENQSTEIQKVGAWLALEGLNSEKNNVQKDFSREGVFRIADELEPFYRRAVDNAKEKHTVESDWNAPILIKAPNGSPFTSPVRGIWVLVLIFIWPVLWVITRINLLFKK